MCDYYNIILYNNKKYTKTKMDKTSITTIKRKIIVRCYFTIYKAKLRKICEEYQICSIICMTKKMYLNCIAYETIVGTVRFKIIF